MRLTLLLTFLFLLKTSGQEIHVKQGALNGDGSLNKPFSTLDEGVLALSQKQNHTLFIHSGNYRRTKSLDIVVNGSKNQAKTIKAYKNSKVQITGGVPLLLKSLLTTFPEELKKRLRPELKSKIVAIDLKSLSIKHSKIWPNYFDNRGGLLDLIYKGKRLQIARWPNTGTATMKKVIDNGSTSKSDRRGGSFIYSDKQHETWPVDKGIWLRGYWRIPWAVQTLRVKSLDKNKKVITFIEPIQMGIGSKYHRPNGSGKEPYWVENQIEEIDQPGEWAIDFESQILLLYPPAKLEDGDITIADMKDPIFRIKNSSNLSIQGLLFEGGLGNVISIDSGESVTVQNCTVRASGEYAVMLNGGTKHTVKDSHFYNLGSGGVRVRGGDRKTLTPCKHQVINNHIHNYGELKKVYAAAVDLNYAEGTVGVRVANNLIHHSPHVGILVSGNDNLIELNEIHHVCLISNDMGGIYTWYDWTSHGNTIRHNYIHSSPQAHGIYFDDGDSGDYAYGNIIEGVDAAVFIGGGHDNIVKYNFIKDCKIGVHIDARGTSRNYTAKNPRLTGRLKAMKVSEGLWSKRYPTLENYLTNHPDLPTGCKINENTFSNCELPIRKKANKLQLADVIFSNNITLENKTSIEKALVSSKIKEIKMIPFNKIGLQK